MRKDYSSVKVKRGYKQGKDGIWEPFWVNIKFTKNHVRRYNNHSHRTAKLTPCAKLLLDFICEEANSHDNTVFNALSERKRFIDFCKKNCKIQYKDETVKKAYYNLRDNHLLLSYTGKGVFTLNPRYLFIGSEKARRELMQEACSFASEMIGSKGVLMRTALGFPNPSKAFKNIPHKKKKRKDFRL